jgi:hypothetical protein
MAIEKIDVLAKLLEAYGVGVRAGVLTPCLEDENEFRVMLGLKSASSAVVQAWTTQGGTRAPVTLQRPKELEDSTPAKQGTEGDDGDEGKTKDEV